jgi:hypothetical protein
MNWAGRLAGEWEMRNTYKILVLIAKCKSHLGWARLRWLDYIKID